MVGVFHFIAERGGVGVRDTLYIWLPLLSLWDESGLMKKYHQIWRWNLPISSLHYSHWLYCLSCSHCLHCFHRLHCLYSWNGRNHRCRVFLNTLSLVNFMQIVFTLQIRSITHISLGKQREVCAKQSNLTWRQTSRVILPKSWVISKYPNFILHCENFFRAIFDSQDLNAKCHFLEYHKNVLIFIGPESDHCDWQPLSLTHNSLTDV